LRNFARDERRRNVRCIWIVLGTVQLLVNDARHRRVDCSEHQNSRRCWRRVARICFLDGFLVARSAFRKHRHGPDGRVRRRESSVATRCLGCQDCFDAATRGPRPLLMIASRQCDALAGTRHGLAMRPCRLWPLRTGALPNLHAATGAVWRGARAGRGECTHGSDPHQPARAARAAYAMHAREVDGKVARHLRRRPGRARGISLYLQLDRSRRLHD
jgi:hypothetical protein